VGQRPGFGVANDNAREEDGIIILFYWGLREEEEAAVSVRAYGPGC